jgi:hypothetical protein
LREGGGGGVIACEKLLVLILVAIGSLCLAQGAREISLTAPQQRSALRGRVLIISVEMRKAWERERRGNENGFYVLLFLASSSSLLFLAEAHEEEARILG